MKEAGFTLLELLAVIIIIGILAAIALPNFAPMRENVLDREASASLKLIQAAQKIYKMENAFYFPHSLDDSQQEPNANMADINQNLRLMLQTTSSAPWGYKCTRYPSGSATASCTEATRSTDNNRKWHMSIMPGSSDANPSPGACP